MKTQYNTVRVDTLINLYRLIENISIFCGGVSFGDYWTKLLSGNSPQVLDVKMDADHFSKYMFSELHQNGIVIQQLSNSTYELWFNHSPTIKATLIIHSDFVGHGICCDCFTNYFESVKPDSFVYVWTDQSESEPTIQTLSYF